MPSKVLTLDALGTTWWIEAKLSTPLENELRKTIQLFESNYSRFSSDSLVGKLNGGTVATHPPEELQAMLHFAQNLYTKTDGLFNVTVGGELEKNGYGTLGSTGRVSDPRDSIHFHTNKVYLSESTSIDFGGFGKAWLIQKLADILVTSGVDDFLINGGGDMMAHGTDKEIALEHPLNQTQHIGIITIGNQALACSSTVKRQWQKDGVDHTHILHPTAKQSENEFIASYVVGDSILDADICATLLLIANSEERYKLKTGFAIEYLLVRSDLSQVITDGFPTRN